MSASPAPKLDLLGSAAEMGERLRRDLASARRASIAVAFAKESALSVVDLAGWCAPERELRLLAGTDFLLTDLGLLDRLGPLPGASCRVFHGALASAGSARPTFHPKLYLLEEDDRVIAYVGSSNLTRGGLAQNIEANVRIEAPANDATIVQATRMFGELFDGEFATPLSAEFAARYREMQEAQRRAMLTYPTEHDRTRLRVAETLLVARYRSEVASTRWLLVVTPENYAVCMRTGTWGRQHEHQIRQYRPGDVFLFHVTEGRGVATMGMFTGDAYFDDAPLWREMQGGAFPWRIRFVALAELRTAVPTREVLEPSRQGAPKNWFQGFIQASHALSAADFEMLRHSVEQAAREDAGLD